MFTLNFNDPGSLEPKRVGGKALGLAQMSRWEVPVSPGYTVTTDAYRLYLEQTGLGARLEEALRTVDRSSTEGLDLMSRMVSFWFEDVVMPVEMVRAVEAGYEQLCEDMRLAEVSVAVRSSATAEDSAGASFAGEYETFVGVEGAAEVERHIRLCWASAFTPRALTYAWKNGISPIHVEMAVVVQKTVNARAAGVMFTLSPTTGDRSRIVIEAAYGLGLSVVGGEVTPDRFVVAKIGGNVVDRMVGDKHIEYVTGDRATPVDDERRRQFCLDDEEVKALAQYGKAIEKSHGMPMDIEFALDRDLPAGSNIVFLQCRPETVWSNRRAPATYVPITDPASAVLAATIKR